MLALWFTSARAFLARVPWQIWAALALLAACWLWGNHRYSQGVTHERAIWEAAAAKAKARADKATVQASDERAADTIRNHDLERARTDAIDKNPGSPRRALNCERLRQAGLDAASAGC